MSPPIYWTATDKERDIMVRAYVAYQKMGKQEARNVAASASAGTREWWDHVARLAPEDAP